MRLPVDRVFTIKGAGTVVTGTLWSGTATPGDEVEVLPSGECTRIRAVQVHGEPVERATAGHRVALNLNALSTDDVRPGFFLAAPGTVSSTDRFDAEVRFLGVPGKAKPLESGVRVHVAHGTREVCGRVLFMGGRTELACGERAFAQIRLDEPLPVAWRDRFVLRSYSPVHVMGGGTVLRAHPRRTTALPPEVETLLEALLAEDEAAVANAAFALEAYPLTASELAHTSGLTEKAANRELATLATQGSAIALEDDRHVRYTTRQALQKHRATIENALLRFHAEQPDASGITKAALRQRCLPRMDVECFDALLNQAAAEGMAVVDAGEVSHPKAVAGARKREEQAAEQLHAILTAAASAPPTIAELVSASGLNSSAAHRTLGALEKQGRVKRVGQDFYFDAAALAALEDAVRNRLAAGPASAAELKDAMGTSRKYAIPLLEYFDAKGVTRREGDLRVLNTR